MTVLISDMTPLVVVQESSFPSSLLVGGVREVCQLCSILLQTVNIDF